jgi:hypothetical protein
MLLQFFQVDRQANQRPVAVGARAAL